MKTVRVRFPSDDEWAERQRRRKVIVKQLGRGISETTIPNGEDIDAALLAKIRTEEEPEVDAFEAQKVIEQLATCEVDDVVLAGDCVPGHAPGAGRDHHAPAEDAVGEGRDRVPARLRARAGPAVQPAGIHHQHARGGDLYKKLIEATEGYVGDVPIIHQAVAVKAAIDALDASFQEDRDANF